MHKLRIGELSKLNLNRYEAIIVASKHARHLNNRRIKALEKMEEDPSVEIEARKMTMIALRDLLSGEVKYLRNDSI